MTSKTYSFVSGVIFLIVALVHALRLLNGWVVTMGAWTLPVWVSWIGVIVGVYLAWQGLKKRA